MLSEIMKRDDKRPDFKFYDEDGSPKTCPHCGSKTFIMETKAYVQEHESEIEYICAACDETVAYWAYGYFDPRYAVEAEGEKK